MLGCLAFHKIFNQYSSNPWVYYLPGKWVPHCTLAVNLNNAMVNKAIDVCKNLMLPIDVEFQSIGLFEFKSNKQLIEYRFEYSD